MRAFDISCRHSATLGEWARRRAVPLVSLGVFLLVIGAIALWHVLNSTFTTVFALGSALAGLAGALSARRCTRPRSSRRIART
jgi:uncharacterized membrane protein HdeD (DUF308 family)